MPISPSVSTTLATTLALTHMSLLPPFWGGAHKWRVLSHTHLFFQDSSRTPLSLI